MSTLKLEVGRYYRTRNGNKARIYALDGGAFQEAHGAVFSGGGWCLTSWDEIGNRKRMYGDDGSNDIVAEWEETTPEPTFSQYTEERIAILLGTNKYGDRGKIIETAVAKFFVEKMGDCKAKVSLSHRYKTRHGIDVTLYSTSAKGTKPVHGCIHTPHGDLIASWGATGQCNPPDESDCDLVEVEDDD